MKKITEAWKLAMENMKRDNERPEEESREEAEHFLDLYFKNLEVEVKRTVAKQK
jgi:hypothetical protein